MKGLHTYMKVEQYIEQLESKGFQLGEDGKGFIFFGKEMTNAPDELVNAAIELTLKSKITFDGSFFISLLESMMSQEIQSRKEALQFAEEYKLLV